MSFCKAKNKHKGLSFKKKKKTKAKKSDCHMFTEKWLAADNINTTSTLTHYFHQIQGATVVGMLSFGFPMFRSYCSKEGKVNERNIIISFIKLHTY